MNTINAFLDKYLTKQNKIKLLTILFAGLLIAPFLFMMAAYSYPSVYCRNCEAGYYFDHDVTEEYQSEDGNSAVTAAYIYKHGDNPDCESYQKAPTVLIWTQTKNIDSSSATWYVSNSSEYNSGATYATVNASEEGTGTVDWSDDVKEEEEERAFGENFIRGMIETVFSGNDFADDSMFNPIVLLNSTYVYIVDALDLITSSDWYMFIVGLALVILILRVFTDYAMDDTSFMHAENATLEQVMRPFIGMIFAILFMLLAPNLIKLFLSLAQSAVIVISNSNGIGEAAQDTAGLMQTAEDQLIELLGFEAGGITKLIGNIAALIEGVLVLILPWLICLVCQVGMFFVAFSRVLEICIRVVFIPLALTDTYKDAGHSHGMHYLYTTLGLCFEALAIYVVIIACNYITASVIGEVSGELSTLITTATETSKFSRISLVCLSLAALDLAKLTLTMKAGSLAKEAFGG